MNRSDLRRLSDYAAARDWIDQFSLGDRSAAFLLVDNLRFVDSSELESRLTSMVQAVIDAADDGAVALYAVRDSETCYFADYRSKPISVEDPKCGAGSEFRIANLITTLAKTNRNVYDHPTVSCLRSKRVKRVVLVDDIIASGARAERFLGAFFHPPAGRKASIRSWHSFGCFKLDLVAYAATDLGLKRVKSFRKSNFVVHTHTAVPTLRTALGNAASDVERMLEQVTPTKLLGPNKRMALGYGSVGALLAFSHSVPNNTPALLWASERSRWRALFPSNRVPSRLLPAIHSIRPEGLVDTLLRIERGHYVPQHPTDTALKSALQLVVESARRGRQIATPPLFGSARFASLQYTLESLGYVHLGRLTDKGRQALRSVSRTDCASGVDIDDRMYYPRSLRRSGSV